MSQHIGHLFDPDEKGAPSRHRSAASGSALFPAVLSWTHYRLLIAVEKPEARAFYEIEAARESWSVRELERQIAALLFERLSMNRDKGQVLALAREGPNPMTELDARVAEFAERVFARFVAVGFIVVELVAVVTSSTPAVVVRVVFLTRPVLVHVGEGQVALAIEMLGDLQESADAQPISVLEARPGEALLGVLVIEEVDQAVWQLGDGVPIAVCDGGREVRFDALDQVIDNCGCGRGLGERRSRARGCAVKQMVREDDAVAGRNRFHLVVTVRIEREQRQILRPTLGPAENFLLAMVMHDDRSARGCGWQLHHQGSDHVVGPLGVLVRCEELAPGGPRIRRVSRSDSSLTDRSLRWRTGSSRARSSADSGLSRRPTRS